MAAGIGKVQVYEKTSMIAIAYLSIVRFTAHVQLKRVRPRTVEAYEMMLHLLARWAGQNPAELDEERVRRYERRTGVPPGAGDLAGDRCIEFPRPRHPAGCRAGQPGHF